MAVGIFCFVGRWIYCAWFMASLRRVYGFIAQGLWLCFRFFAHGRVIYGILYVVFKGKGGSTAIAGADKTTQCLIIDWEKGEKMSIMIDIPPAVVEKAEAYAQERGTTLSRMFGDYIASLEVRSSCRDWRKTPVSSRVRRLVGIIPDDNPEMSYSEMISKAVAEHYGVAK